MNFTHVNSASRVRFGAGSRFELAAELDALGWRRVLFIATEREAALAREIAEHCGDRVVGFFDDAQVHVPQATVESAERMAAELKIDATVSVGGGSTVGLSKMLSLNMGIPSLAIATTYAGSEMTPIWGTTRGDVKTTGKDPVVKPAAILYDPELTLTLPMAISGPSALNAMAHAVEALWAVDATPVTTLMAKEGIRALNQALPALALDDQDLAARGQALYGAWLCGTVLGQCSMALHHKICHVLGGAFNLPHAPTHACVLPYAVAYNAPAVPAAMADLAEALAVPAADVAGRLWDLREQMNSPGSLAALGVAESSLPRAVELATQNPYANPVAISEQGVTALLAQIYQGQRPSSGPIGE